MFFNRSSINVLLCIVFLSLSKSCFEISSLKLKTDPSKPLNKIRFTSCFLTDLLQMISRTLQKRRKKRGTYIQLYVRFQFLPRQSQFHLADYSKLISSIPPAASSSSHRHLLLDLEEFSSSWKLRIKDKFPSRLLTKAHLELATASFDFVCR